MPTNARNVKAAVTIVIVAFFGFVFGIFHFFPVLGSHVGWASGWLEIGLAILRFCLLVCFGGENLRELSRLGIFRSS